MKALLGFRLNLRRPDPVSPLDQLQHHVHQRHDYLIEIENSSTLELPLSDADFDSIGVGRSKDDDQVTEYGDSIREEPALYLVN